jgi:hypothetical protein
VHVDVETEHGVYTVDLDEDAVVGLQAAASLPEPAEVPVSLPRVVCSAASGSTVVAVVDARPPLMVSHDGGRTWRASGRGLPAGRAVAIGDEDPDLLVFGGRNRLFVSRDGGRFWRGSTVELPEIAAIALPG